jgi:3-oxoacyl-[acyl-carrier-protein] synthase III
MGTATPDMPVAATGVYVATEIGATNAFALTLQLVPVFCMECVASAMFNLEI